MYNILLIDDNQNDLRNLQDSLINLLPKNNDFHIDCCQDVSHIPQLKYDIVFLDIDMPQMGGFEIAHCFDDCFLIFVTNRDDLVFDCFEYHPFAFIRKFLLNSELENTLSRLLLQLYKKNQLITVHSYGQDIHLKVSDIMYIESYLHNCTIHTLNGDISIRTKLSDLKHLIHNDSFYNIHQSFLVNWNYVKSITKYECTLKNQFLIPVSQRKYKESVEAYHQFILRRL